MTIQAALSAAGRIFTRWHNAGVHFSVLEHLEKLRCYGRQERFDRFLELARQNDLVREDGFTEAAIAVLSDATGWQELTQQYLLLPLLKRLLDNGVEKAHIVQLLRPWSEHPLEVCLSSRCVRALAAQYAASDRSIGAYRAEVLPAILNPMSLTPTPSRWKEEKLAFIEIALPFWGTDEMVPALLAEMVRAVHDANYHRVMRQLELVANTLRYANWDATEICDRLTPPLGAMLASPIDFADPLKPSLFFALLSEHSKISRLLGTSASPVAPSWYGKAAQCLEQFPDAERPSLRKAWVEDVILSWTGDGHGRMLVAPLYESWCRATPRNVALGDDVVQLLVDAALPLGVTLESIAVPILETQLLQAQMKTFQPATVDCYLRTCRMLGLSRLVRSASILLARLVQSHRDPDAEAALLIGLAASSEPLHQAVGEVASTMLAHLEADVCRLLWEIVLSPVQCRPSLKARLDRVLNVARIGNVSHKYVDALRKLIFVVSAPETDHSIP